MLQDMKIKQFTRKNKEDLDFPLYKKNAITTSPLPQTEIVSTLRDFVILKTKDVDRIPPKIDLVRIDPIYINNNTIPIDTGIPNERFKSNNNEKDKVIRSNSNNPKGQLTRSTMNSTNITKQNKQSVKQKQQQSTNPSRVSLLKQQLEAITSYETLISEKEKVVKSLWINIEAMESKLLHVRRELKQNLNDNYHTSDYAIRIAFEQDKTRSIQSQIDNELPVLRKEISAMKERILQLESNSESMNVVISKYNTEKVFIIEDIKKISKVLIEIKKDMLLKDNELMNTCRNIKEIKIAVHECEKSNGKLAQEMQKLIEI